MISGASTCTGGSSAGNATSTTRPPRRPSILASAVPTRSSTVCQSRRRRTSPASKRIRSSTFEISSDISCALASIEWTSCARAAGSSLRSGSFSALLAPVMTASGVRRSCEIEASKVFRRLSVSAETRACSAFSASCERSIASAICPAKVSSRCRCSGSSSRRLCVGRTASTPSVLRIPVSGRYWACAAGSVSVPRPAGRSWSNTHCATDRSGFGSAPEGASPFGMPNCPCASGIRIVALLAKVSARCLIATRARLSKLRVTASSRLIPYNRDVRLSRAPATRDCARTLATRFAMTSAITSITPNVSRYSRLLVEKV